MRIIVSAVSFAEPSAANDNGQVASPRFRERIECGQGFRSFFHKHSAGDVPAARSRSHIPAVIGAAFRGNAASEFETIGDAAARLLAAMDGRRNGGGANVTRSPAAVPLLRAVNGDHRDASIC